MRREPNEEFRVDEYGCSSASQLSTHFHQNRWLDELVDVASKLSCRTWNWISSRGCISILYRKYRKSWASGIWEKSWKAREPEWRKARRKKLNSRSRFELPKFFASCFFRFMDRQLATHNHNTPVSSKKTCRSSHRWTWSKELRRLSSRLHEKALKRLASEISNYKAK